MSFWKNSTDQQKIDQILGCIEIGMNLRQTAMNLGAKYNEATSTQVAYFWRSLGFKFPTNFSETTKKMNHIATATAGRSAGVPEIEKKNSFKIFEHEEEKSDPFEGLGSY